MLLINTGNGKGKTTAAAGLALRAWGHGKRVLFIMFLKGSGISGEYKAIEKIGSPDLQVLSFGRKCPYPGQDCCPGQRECIVTADSLTDADYMTAHKGLEKSALELNSGNWDLVILDEIINLYQVFPEYQEEIVELIDTCPESVDLVLTGRECPQQLGLRSDLLTEMIMRKHPFEKKIIAKRGIDY
jgi:cob(I)alamin adenosyltransferase